MKPIFIFLVVTLFIASCGDKTTTCPDYTTGQNCVETAPQSITVTSIRITKFIVQPQPKEVSVRVSDGAQPTNFKDSQITGASLWIAIGSFKIEPYSTMKVLVLNADVGGSITTLSAQPYQAGKGFPAILQLKNSEVEIEVRVTYTH